ncbi:MAG: DNA cytosine methyltransferase [Alphaproteobacteria bacterium]|nr:DNA cytosine methyltransferase [Alphaproteobacteria bacterium]
MQNKFKYIDLFAGCGGLSLGLERAGFSLELAVEKSDMAAETFYHNFIEKISDVAAWKKYASETSSIQEQAKTKLIVKELEKVLKNQELMRTLRQKDIDLVAGGPPCQGFSMAGKRNPNDARNVLPWQFLEFVEKVQPKAVLIENVAGMRQTFVKHNEEAPFEQLRKALAQTGAGYTVQPVLLNAMHFGVPQHRPRVMLLGIRNDISRTIGLEVSEETWKSEYEFQGSFLFEKRPALAPRPTHSPENVLSVGKAIWDLAENGYKAKGSDKRYLGQDGAFARDCRNSSLWPLPSASGELRTQELKNHVFRNHADQIILRFRLYQYLRDNGIPSRVLNIPAKMTSSLSSKLLAVKEVLWGAAFPAKSPDGVVLARTPDELAQLIVDLGTKKHSQRPLKLNEPAPTVVSLPDDFVHPTEPRTLTVRELARFQSFPDFFEFRAKETTGSMRRRFEVPQYTQVGNAVPPLLAYAVGKAFYDVLSRAAAKPSKRSVRKAA